MLWKEVKSEIRLGTLTEMMRDLDPVSALCAMVNLLQGIRIYASCSCTDSVMAHLRSKRTELGGLLLGRIYQADVRSKDPSQALTIITRSLPSIECRSSSASLQMDSEVWCRVPEPCLTGEIVVGWYHSHPNLGAFFSGIDRRTQCSLFNHHYSLGLVIDPFDDQQRVFTGEHCEEYKHDIVLLDHEGDAPEDPSPESNCRNDDDLQSQEEK